MKAWLRRAVKAEAYAEVQAGVKALLEDTNTETVDHVTDSAREAYRNVLRLIGKLLDPVSEDALLVCPRLPLDDDALDDDDPFVVTSLREDHDQVAVLTFDGTTAGNPLRLLDQSRTCGVGLFVRQLLDTLDQPYRIVGPAELLEYLSRPEAAP